MHRIYLIDAIPLVTIILVFVLHFKIRQIDTDYPDRTQNTYDKKKIETDKLAFATLTTPAFAMGVVSLGHTLHKYHGNKYDYVCLVTPDVNETWIKVLSQWWKIVKVPGYRPFKSFRRSWAKLYIWDLTEYSKIVYLDSDMLVMGPIDELFGYPELSCACDPDPPQICNTGVLVVEPKSGMLEDMKRTAKTTKLIRGIGDQSFINSYFKSFHVLPTRFNSPRSQSTGLTFLMKRNLSRVIHFICKKPWKCGRKNVTVCGCGYPKLNQYWWDVWDEACKNRFCIESWD